MKEQILKILDEGKKYGYSNEAITGELLCLYNVSNSALIDYIETEAEVLIPIEEMFNKDGTHITKNEYGKVVIKYLAKELREHYC